MAMLISIGAFVMTMLGGMLALRLKDRLHLVLGFSAGAVLAVAFFDLMPEAVNLATPTFELEEVLTIVVLGFVIYMILDRTIAPRHHDDAPRTNLLQGGKLGAGSLSVHSYLDGFAIGLSFQVSASVGAIVSTAVLVHDFSDGVNTVGIVLGKDGGRRSALGWLLIDAAAPVIGAASTMLLKFPPYVLGLCLALFSGFFFYISASDLLPESYHDHPTRWTTAMTLLGIVTLYIAVRIAG